MTYLERVQIIRATARLIILGYFLPRLREADNDNKRLTVA